MICYINGTITRRFSLTDPLLCAGFSARAYNTLVDANIQTIQDLLRCDRKRLEHIRGMGRKSVGEVLDFLHHLWTYPDLQKLYPLAPENISLLGTDAFHSWSEQMPEDLMDRPLSSLPLSTRAYNCLRRSGCHTIGALAELSYKDILKIRSLGKRTADEILDVMNHYIQKHSCLPANRMDQSTPASQACFTFFRSVFRSSLICDLTLYREILEEFESAYNKARPVNYAALYQKELLRQAAAVTILEILDLYPFGLERGSLSLLIPEALNLPEEVLDIILFEMEETGSIRTNGVKICLCRMSIIDLVEKIPDDRLKGMIIQRLNGLSLREISTQYHLSQERIRQIVFEGLTKRATRVEEDKYLPIFKTYRFSKEEFMLAFCEPAETYYYLTIIVGNTSRVPISQYEDDPSLPAEIRQGICTLLHQDSVSINGEYIERNQTSFTKFILLTYFPDDVSFDTLYAKYNELLRNLGLEKDPKLLVHERSYINHLRAMDFLLWKPGCICRYYDIEARNYDELLDTLGLAHYHNVEYSTRRFFLDEPDLMRKYDIRDEFELHNLLRKVCTKRKMKGIQFLRMPFISFGVSSRSHQVYEILLANSPISQRSFLEQYDAVYGLDPKTNPQQYLAPFAQYCREGIYDVRGISAQAEEEGAPTPPLRQDIPLSRPGC